MDNFTPVPDPVVPNPTPSLPSVPANNEPVVAAKTATPKENKTNMWLMFAGGFVLGAAIVGGAVYAVQSGQNVAKGMDTRSSSSEMSSSVSTSSRSSSASSTTSTSSSSASSSKTTSGVATTSQSPLTMKTCTNADLKISIQVPSTWVCKNINTQGQYYLEASDNSGSQFSIGTPAIGYLPDSGPVKQIKVASAGLTVNVYSESDEVGDLSMEVFGNAKATGAVKDVVISGNFYMHVLTPADSALLEAIFTSYKQL